MASSLVLNRSSKVPAQDTAAFGAIAERFRRAGALDKAVSLCREGLKKFPDHVSARVTLGWSLLDLGQYEEARVELEQVLRRAPDNLAAIRGLAELHDRFEHTLNLPMDGPGQWPPSAAEVEGLAAAPTAALAVCESDSAEHAAAASGADAGADEGPAVMVPADMGMPIWSPVARAASSDVPAAPAMSAATGMSSFREIDFSPSVATEAPVHVSSAAEPAVDVAALIAEAESLEAAAEAAVVLAPEAVELGLDHAPTVDLLADLDLSTGQDLAAQLHLADELDNLTSPVTESDVPLTLELAVSDDDSALEVLAAADVPPTVEAAAVIDPEIVIEAVAEAEPEVVIEPAAQVEPEVVIEAAAEAEPEVVIEAVAETEPEAVIEDAMPVESVAALEAAVGHEFANVLAFAPVGDAVVSSLGPRASAHAALPALERMLRQVQARRLQLMAESVA